MTLPIARILLVDDDPEARDLAKSVLKSSGFDIQTADNGREALEKALAQPPDLVVTDVMMPEMSGWTLARSLRSHPHLSLVPIIFLTALDSPDDALRGFALGADDYLPKSSALQDLPRMVDRAMMRRLELHAFVEKRSRAATFRGDLEKLGLSAVLFLLESVAKTGTLRVQSRRSKAVLFVRQGAIIGAEMADTDALKDAHVVYHVAGWTTGDFEFVEGAVDGPDLIGKATTELLLEAAHRQDEVSDAS